MLENTKRRNVKDFHAYLNALACEQFYIARGVAISETANHFVQHLIYWIPCGLTIVTSLKVVKRNKYFRLFLAFFLDI